MNLREKYGEWGLILGATEGVGKAFCEKIAAGGMNVVMVGRREEKLNVLAGEIRETYGVETKVVRAAFSQPGAAATEGLDMGFMSYVACLHSFGKIQDTPWEKHEAMINVNVVTFLKCFHHYMRIFATQDRGAVINVSSMTGISSSPWNGQYGAGKAFILKMTEAVACECEGTGVDVEVITLGTTLTPSLLSNLPGGPQGEAVMKIALTPEECVDEAFEKLGKELSVIAGQRNKDSVHDWKANHTEDEYIRYMGERIEFGMRNMTKSVNAAGISSTELYILLVAMDNRISAQESTVNGLRGTVTGLQGSVSDLQTALAALTERVKKLEGTEG